MHCLLLGNRLIYNLNLIKQLFTALGTLYWLLPVKGLKLGNNLLLMLYITLLIIIFLQLCIHKLLFLCRIVGIIPRKYTDNTSLHLNNLSYHLVKEITVMCNYNNTSIIIHKIIFKPCYWIHIKMIRRLIKHNYVRLWQQ